MPKFRKRPIVVDAFQWDPSMEDGLLWEHKIVKYYFEDQGYGLKRIWYVPTKQGQIKVNEGDWLITGIDGELYPCADSIFKTVYEPVEYEEEYGGSLRCVTKDGIRNMAEVLNENRIPIKTPSQDYMS